VIVSAEINIEALIMHSEGSMDLKRVYFLLLVSP
jgi:hypothetical protein